MLASTDKYENDQKKGRPSCQIGAAATRSSCSHVSKVGLANYENANVENIIILFFECFLIGW